MASCELVSAKSLERTTRKFQINTNFNFDRGIHVHIRDFFILWKARKDVKNDKKKNYRTLKFSVFPDILDKIERSCFISLCR